MFAASGETTCQLKVVTGFQKAASATAAHYSKCTDHFLVVLYFFTCRCCGRRSAVYASAAAAKCFGGEEKLEIKKNKIRANGQLQLERAPISRGGHLTGGVIARGQCRPARFADDCVEAAPLDPCPSFRKDRFVFLTNAPVLFLLFLFLVRR